MLHVFYRTIALRNTLQAMFAKLMISSEITLILHVFLAECVIFLTYKQHGRLCLVIFLRGFCPVPETGILMQAKEIYYVRT